MWPSLVAGLALLAVGFGAGWTVHDWRDAAGQQHAAEVALKTARHQAAVSQTLAVANQRAQDRQRTVTRTLIEKVPIYVTPRTDREYPLPVGFVRLHDAAVAGADLPAAAEGPAGADDAPSDVTAARAAVVIVGNYGACRADQQRLADLQAWARQQGLAD